MTISLTDAAALDSALEKALGRGDFVATRKALLEWGYPLPEDEFEPDIYEALCKSLKLDQVQDVVPDTAGLLVYIEELIRDRNSEALRLMLFLNGHKIEKPEFVKRRAAECSDQGANETPVHFTHSPPKPF